MKRIEFDPGRLSRIADVDPHVDRDKFERFIQVNYSSSVGETSVAHDVEEENLEFSLEQFNIKGVRSRPGIGGAKLGRETLSNYPTESGDYEIYRGDPISLKTYRKMSADPEIAFGTFLLKGWVGGLPYTVECSDKLIQGVVTHVLDKIWKDCIRNMMDAVRNGFAFGEKVWEREDVMIVSEDDTGTQELIYEGKIVCINKIKFLDPSHSFSFFKKNDEISRVEQRQRLKKVSVDRSKLVWFALDQEYSSVFGRSRYKNIYSEWYYSSVNMKYLLLDLQKRGSPHMEVRYPPGVTRVGGKTMNNADIALMMAQKLRANGIVAIPSTMVGDSKEPAWSIHFADTKQSSSKSPFLDFLKYSDQRKMKGLGIPPSVTGIDSNFSSADAGGDMLVVVVEDIVNQLEDRIQKDIVDSIVEYNFGPKYKSIVRLKIDKSALGRRNLMKEILKTMLRAGSSIKGRTLKVWPDVASMMNELGMSYTSFEDTFIEVEGFERESGETPVDEAIADEDSNDTENVRDPDDVTRDDSRPTEKDSITEVG